MPEDVTIAAPATRRTEAPRTPGARTPRPAQTCRVWWARPTRFSVRDLEVLSTVERERRESTHRADDQDRFTTGAVLLRLALGSALGIPPQNVPIDRRCPECQGAHGRPRVPGILGVDCSVTHTESQVGIAVVRGRRIGIDAEEVVEQDEFDDLAATALTQRERASLARRPRRCRAKAFTELWTAKEAALKATGDGLRVCPSALEVCATGTGLRFTRLPDIPALARGAVLRPLRPRAGVATLAVLGREPVTVHESPASALFGGASATPADATGHFFGDRA
ncbi:4'-phosphopantetheinyl transferase family protein [Streptomyces luteolus]|uniref:4'-phosphopantetheinyl transferase superfamily protein n=1 Tax=Streptomyces luteolus TaxID=3043615 RepID=A0ABT6T2L4_9ACTN|nr:4'-phosphopantetheinyl transferase superfamily protein [Streptomyces sp. B-S-A12]MDI3422100.1 4'-phosphopantetheinyl transferase superfamily protein [Streptomyces sp. B-S-A12]